jgi:hypothetical protein
VATRTILPGLSIHISLLANGHVICVHVPHIPLTAWSLLTSCLPSLIKGEPSVELKAFFSAVNSIYRDYSGASFSDTAMSLRVRMLPVIERNGVFKLVCLFHVNSPDLNVKGRYSVYRPVRDTILISS